MAEPSKSHEHIANGYINQDKFSSRVHEQRVEEVRNLLESKYEDPVQSLILVDCIKRLGIEYHFEEEIQAILERHYVASFSCVNQYYTLHEVSLLFRLLRQQGYYISPDIFNKFKGKDGRFKEELKQDIMGLLELYDAAQLGFEGEDTLDEASTFCSQLLSESLKNMECNRSEIVRTRLRHPHQKSISRLHANIFLEDLKGTNGWGQTLTELSKMDVSMGQNVHEQEFLQFSKWWKGLGLLKELRLVRDQPLKWWTWSMVAIDNCRLSEERIELSKSIAFIYVIDDIFDLYGTLDDLELFTRAIKRWDYAEIDALPNYMKMPYKALVDTTNDLGHKLRNKHGYDPMESLKETWATLYDAFLVEAKWFASEDLPTATEYLENGKVSSGAHVVAVHLFFLLGLCEKMKGSIHLSDISEFSFSVATILRLWDDLGSAKDEDQDGKDGSYIDYYIKEHRESTVEQAREHVLDMISREWKHLNKESFLLNQTPGLSNFTKALLNMARMIPLVYSYDNSQPLNIIYSRSLELHQAIQ